MDDNEKLDSASLTVLEGMLGKYPLNDEEQAALRNAIGLLAWTKLVEGFNERRKKARDRRDREL